MAMFHLLKIRRSKDMFKKKKSVKLLLALSIYNFCLSDKVKIYI